MQLVKEAQPGMAQGTAVGPACHTEEHGAAGTIAAGQSVLRGHPGDREEVRRGEPALDFSPKCQLQLHMLAFPGGVPLCLDM